MNTAKLPESICIKTQESNDGLGGKAGGGKQISSLKHLLKEVGSEGRKFRAPGLITFGFSEAETSPGLRQENRPPGTPGAGASLDFAFS